MYVSCYQCRNEYLLPILRIDRQLAGNAITLFTSLELGNTSLVPQPPPPPPPTVVPRRDSAGPDGDAPFTAGERTVTPVACRTPSPRFPHLPSTQRPRSSTSSRSSLPISRQLHAPDISIFDSSNARSSILMAPRPSTPHQDHQSPSFSSSTQNANVWDENRE